MTKKNSTRFDDALPRMVELVEEYFGSVLLTKSLFLRDATGRLTLILRSKCDSRARKAFDEAAEKSLGAYVAGPSATPEEIFDEGLHDPGLGLLEPVQISGHQVFVRLLDRRIAGQDWNTPNFSFELPIPTITFFSCKGGVGRSTALAVSAAALSEAGFNVIIVDMDLEAPGLGTMLLNPEELPEFGVLDYFIESNTNPIDAAFLEDCIAPSPLTAGRGLIEVMPAVGRRSVAMPQNVLPKIGRAVLERETEPGATASFMQQVQTLLEAIAGRGRSNVVLVDARAGLSESSAATVVGLGGTVLLFGVDTPQTFECYRYLFAQLNRYALEPDKPADWRYNLQMVHAKAGRGIESYEHFRDQTLRLFSEFLYEEADPGDFEAFNFDVDDDSAPHYAWPIPFDAEFTEFDPRSRRDQLSREFFDRSFGSFVGKILEVVDPEGRRRLE